MIGKLRGTVDSVSGDHCIIDVGGVGYVAYCPTGTLAELTVGVEASLLIDTVAREDMIRLFGFTTAVEREWFRALQASVQGVGAKVAISVLSVLSPAQLAAAISSKDIATICRAPGIGKKVAERIVAEMQNKMPAGSDAAGQAATTAPAGGAAGDAVSALVNLGYPAARASAAVAKALESAGADADSATLIRLGIRAVG